MGRPDPACKLYDIYHCYVNSETPDDGQRNCPKHVEFYSKNKFEKFVHLVGFIIRMRANVFVLYGMRLTFNHLMYFILTKVSICYNNKLSYFLYFVRLFHTFISDISQVLGSKA